MHSHKWRDIGLHLGFHQGELENIQALPSLISSAPQSWLNAMLENWLQWTPGDPRGSSRPPYIEDLKGALLRSGLKKTAYDIAI